MRDLLRSSQPFIADESFAVYEVRSVLAERVEDYIYFAASVFWRAAARAWTFGNAALSRLRLGPYEELLRVYLLGEGPFPSTIRLFVHVWSDERVHFTTVFPTSSRAPDGTRRHKFAIPGVLFIMFTGEEVASTLDAGALNSHEGQFMWLCPWSDDSLFEGMGNLIKKALNTHRSRRAPSRLHPAPPVKDRARLKRSFDRRG